MDKMNVSGMSDVANIMNEMFSRVKDEQGATGVSNVRFAQTEKADNSLTVTYTDVRGVVRKVDVPELEIPAGTLTAETIMSVLRKLDEISEDIALSATAEKDLQEALDEYADSQPPALPKDTHIGVFDLMQQVLYLLMECANEQIKTSRQIRFSSLMQQYASILAQAKQQETNAYIGMATSIACGVLQAAAVVATTGTSNAVKQVKSDNGVPSSLANLKNAKIMGDPVKAQAAMDKMAQKLEIPETTQAEVRSVIDGKMTEVDGKTVPKAAQDLIKFQTEGEPPRGQLYDQAKTELPAAEAKLQTAQENLAKLERGERPEGGENPVTKKDIADAKKAVDEAKAEVDGLKATISDYDAKVAKYEQGVKVAEAKAKLTEVLEDPKATPEGIKNAQDAYQTEVDKAVDLYKQEADAARAEFKAVRDNPNATKAEKNAARAKLDTAQKNWQYANAARTNALSQSIDGKPVLSLEGRTQEITARQKEFHDAQNAAKLDPAMDEALENMDPLTKRQMWQMIFQQMDSVCQSVVKLLDAQVTRMGAERTMAEQETQFTTEMLQIVRKLVDAAMSFSQALSNSIQQARMV